MWRRLRRRTLAPRRPLLFAGQYVLAFLTVALLVGSIVLVIWAVFA
jgi:hypothetical protein